MAPAATATPDLTVVAVVGPESAGKTTLARAVAERCGGEWSDEAARAYALALGGARALGAADVAPIARRQVALEDAAVERARAAGRRLVVRDTDLVSTAVYARLYYGLAADWLDALVAERRAAHYLLCDADLPWVADPARDPAYEADEARRRVVHAFVGALTRYDCGWSWVRGAGAARLASALDAVRHLGVCI